MIHIQETSRASQQSYALGRRILPLIGLIALLIVGWGIYSPFCVNAFSGFWKWAMLSIIWWLALIGIIVKVFYIRVPRWLNAGIYLVMGWLCLAAIGQMLAVLGKTFKN